MTPKAITIRNLNGKEDGIMKTMKMFVTALVCFAYVACVKENMDPQVSSQPEKGAFVGVRSDFGGTKTKTVLTEDYRVLWDSDDAIAVWDGTEIYRIENNKGRVPSQTLREAGWNVGYRYSVTTKVNSASTGFKYSFYQDGTNHIKDNYTQGTADADGVLVEGFNDISEGYELASGEGTWYLMNSNFSANFIANCETKQFRAWLDDDQKIPVGTFVDSRDFAVAKTQDLSKPVVFKNAISLLEFVVPEQMDGKITKITVTPNATGEYLAGDLLIDYSGDAPVTSLWALSENHNTLESEKSKYTSLKLVPASGSVFAAGKYYAVACPGTLTEGLTVTATLTTGMTLTRSSEKNCTFKESYVYGMGEIGMNYSAPDLSAELVATSSSSLVFTWTHGGNAAIDAAQPYEFALYEDAQCTKEVIKHISDSNSAATVWADVQPKFVFAGLAQDTQYYFKVSNTESKRSSAVIPAKTDKFTIVHNRTEEAGLGDVILAEDFSECVSGGESGLGAAGAKFGGAFKPAVSENFVGFAKYDADPYTQGLNGLTGISDTRLHTWGYYQFTSGKGNVYPHASSVKIGIGSNKSAIVTPVLAAIPDGKVAKVLVKTTVSMRHDLSSLKVMAVALRGDLADKKLNEYVTVASADDTIDEKGKLFELEFALDGVTNDCRVMIGPHTEVANGKGRMYINDITVTVTGLSDL